MVIELAMAAWLGAQPASAPPTNLSDISARLDELDEVAAAEQLGLMDHFQAVRWATADLWLRAEMIDPSEASWGFMSAEPAFGRPSTWAVTLSWGYVRNGGEVESRYVIAHRVSYTNADIEAAIAAAYPVDLMIDGYRRYARSGNFYDWPEARSNWMPDPETVARLVPVERSLTDERSCPGLTAALRRLNGLDVPPVRLQGYGPGDGPPVPPERIWIVGDGTGFLLEVQLATGEAPPTVMTLTGNHGSIPGDWIEAFEADTADCWRPEPTVR